MNGPFERKKQVGPSYRMEKKNDTGELYLYDIIGGGFWDDGTTAKGFAADLKALGDIKTLNIFINSPGGSVFEGVAIYNQLIRHRARKVVQIDGLAASIASIVAMAGDEIRMPSNALMMIHNPYGVVMGESKDMRKAADSLDKIRETLIETYASRSGGDTKDISDMLDAETWFTAEEAVAAGFADSVIGAVEVAALAKHDLSAFRNAPALPAVEAAENSNSSDWVPAPNPILLKAAAHLHRHGLTLQGQP